MDKAEYRIKLEQINSLAEAGDFKGAAAVVDTIDWRHVKSVRTLCMVGEIYEANKRYEDSKRVLEYAYKRSSISKTVLYRLAEINIRTGDYDDAKRFYSEFEQLSPHDTSRYILKYKLLRAEGASLDDQIAVLKEYKEREYTERWAYELAKLYMKNGQKQKCIEECDEMILWFAEGKYVTRAMELKMKLRSLSDTQKKKYNERYIAEEKESAEEAVLEEAMTAEERISKAADLAADDEENASADTAKGKKLSAAEIIRKMDVAADETVSSALYDDRTAPKAAEEPGADEKPAEIKEIVKEDLQAVRDAVKEEAAAVKKLAEEDLKPIREDIATAKEAAREEAAETKALVKEDLNTVKESAEMVRATARQAGEDAAEEAAWKAAALKEAAEKKAAADAEKVVEAAEAFGARMDAFGEKVATDAEMAAAAVEAKAEIIGAQIADDAENAEIEMIDDSVEAGQFMEELAEALGDADQAEAVEADQVETDEAEAADADQDEAEAADVDADRAEADEAEAADVDADQDEVDEAEAADADREEADEAESGQDLSESSDEPEDVEEPAPVSPEEMAKNADEEAERALQEMMASFLNEFAVAGSEYKMTTDIIPDEDELSQDEGQEKKNDRNDRERMLGKETDESLGLTRTESFQEQLKKALEEGGNFEEANQIVIYEEFESPEEAAKRTVMTAHGIEYDPSEEPEDEMAEEDGESGAEEDASFETENVDLGEELENVFEENAESVEAAEGESEEESTDESDEQAEGESDEVAESGESESGSDATSESGESESESDTTSASEESENESDETAESEESEELSEIETDKTTESGEAAEGESDETAEAEEESEPQEEPAVELPDILERVEVMPRKFTEEEEALFSYFTDIPGIPQQATLALADIHNNAGDKTSKSGNILIMGRQLSGKTRLADALICAACLDLNIKAAKVAKVIGEDLNDMDAADIVDQMKGGFLLIEGAGSLSDDFVEKLNVAMEFRTDDLIVILEDEKADLQKMLNKHEEFAKKFTSTIIIPVFTNDELVTFARTYAMEKGYKIDEMGTLALYTMIGENQKDNEPVVIGKVKKMVDRAIDHSKGLKITALFRKNSAADDGRIWLKEKDFRF